METVAEKPRLRERVRRVHAVEVGSPPRRTMAAGHVVVWSSWRSLSVRC